MATEAEYLQHEFIIETETEKKVYVYNFDLMTMDRVLQASEMFRVLEELRQHPPASLKDTKVTVERQIERNAFAALLMKKTTDKEGKIKFEKYEPGMVSSFDFLAELKGAENYHKLEECKTDFFMHTGMLLASSMKGLSDISKSLNDMKPEVVQSILGALTKSGNAGE
jgi:hypothetical protein